MKRVKSSYVQNLQMYMAVYRLQCGTGSIHFSPRTKDVFAYLMSRILPRDNGRNAVGSWLISVQTVDKVYLRDASSSSSSPSSF